MRRIFNGAGGATTTGGGLPSNHHSNQFANHYHNNNNTPATKTGDYIGGSSLDDILSRDGESVPGIVLKCTDILLKKGLGQPGIFRLSPRAQLMDRLTRLVNSRNRVTTSGGGLSTPPRRPPHTPFDFTPASEEDLDSIAVAGLLKFFLRRLPNGVVPPEATKRLLDLKIESNSVETSESLASIYTELCRLSDSHRRLLRYICHLLVFVSRRSKDNHMNCNNLAIIFGPTLFRIHEESDSVEVEDISTMKKQHVVNFLVKKFISEFDYFFSNHSSDLSPYKVPLIYEDMVNSLALSHDSSSIQNNLHNQELMASNSSFQLDTDRSDSVVTPRSESQVLSPHIRKLIRKVIVENLYPEGTDYDNLNEFKPIPAPRSKLHSGLETEVEKPVALSNKHAPSSAPNSAPYSQVTAGYLDHRDHSPESSVDLHHHHLHYSTNVHLIGNLFTFSNVLYNAIEYYFIAFNIEK